MTNFLFFRAIKRFTFFILCCLNFTSTVKYNFVIAYPTVVFRNFRSHDNGAVENKQLEISIFTFYIRQFKEKTKPRHHNSTRNSNKTK